MQPCTGLLGTSLRQEYFSVVAIPETVCTHSGLTFCIEAGRAKEIVHADENGNGISK